MAAVASIAATAAVREPSDAPRSGAPQSYGSIAYHQNSRFLHLFYDFRPIFIAPVFVMCGTAASVNNVAQASPLVIFILNRDG